VSDPTRRVTLLLRNRDLDCTIEQAELRFIKPILAQF
jgi:hypothetical protein